MLDPLRLFADQVAAVLADGESAQAMAGVAYLSGEEVRDAEPPQGPRAVDRLLGLPDERDFGRVSRLLAGTSLIGWPLGGFGSAGARRLVTAWQTGTPESPGTSDSPAAG